MRLRPAPALAIVAVVLAGCGKPSSRPEAPATTDSAAAPEPAPAPFTDARIKAALAALPAAYRGADLDNGAAKFALCKSCHTAVQGGANMTGPNLWGVFGRKAGSAPGFAYSEGLKATGIVWDADKIDRWITNPRKIVPATKMTYIGMQDPKDRADVVAWLKVVTTPGP
ncbi:MAG: cytochrome c family protein [Caulobacteraceae bacterium]